jgi:hypothetical protein
LGIGDKGFVIGDKEFVIGDKGFVIGDKAGNFFLLAITSSYSLITNHQFLFPNRQSPVPIS